MSERLHPGFHRVAAEVGKQQSSILRDEADRDRITSRNGVSENGMYIWMLQLLYHSWIWDTKWICTLVRK